MRDFRIAGLIFILFISFPEGAFPGDDKFVVIKQNDKKGLLDGKGNVAIPAVHDDLGWSKGDPVAVNEVIGFKKGSLWGLISVRNQKIVEPIFAALYPAGEELIASKFSPYSNEVKYGIISSSGKTLASFKYYTLEYDGSCYIASLKRDSLFYGIIDSNDRSILPTRYKKVDRIEDNLYAVADYNGRYAIFNLKAKRLGSFAYDTVYAYNHRLLWVMQNGKQGVADASGRILVAPVYKQIELNNEAVNARPFSRWDLLGGDNAFKATFYYDKVAPAGKNVYKATAGESEGLIDAAGKYLFQPGAYSIQDFIDGIALIKTGGKYGLLRQDGSFILPLEYDSLEILGKTVLAGKTARKTLNWSLLDREGKTLSKHDYHEIKPMGEKLFAVRIDQYWGVIDKEGNSIATCKFDSLHFINDDLILARFVNNEGVLGTDGEWVIPPKKGRLLYLSPESYVVAEDYCHFAVYHKNQLVYCSNNRLTKRKNDLLETREDGKMGLISLQGKVLLNPAYDFISELHGDSIYIFGKDSLYGIIARSGRMITNNLAYEAVYPLREEFIGIKLDGRFGFIDANGKLRIANRYDSIRMFSEGYAAVNLVGRWGYIDKMERLKVQPTFDKAYDFMEGVAIVKKDGKYGIVNKEGRLMLETAFDRLRRLDNGRFISLKDGRFGLIGKDGKELVFPKYDEIRDLENGHIIIRRKDKYGMATADGELIIPIVYDELVYDHYNNLYLGRTTTEWEHFNLPAE